MKKWKTINDWDDYQISKHGQVISLKFGKKRILKYGTVGSKVRRYHAVNLCEYNIKITYAIHSLVAKHFVPNPNNLPIVHHIDNDPLNNHYKNLEWTNNRGNIVHAYAQKKTSSKYTGVSWHAPNGKWVARIADGGSKKHLGYYLTEKKAAVAYRKALKKINSKKLF